MTNKQQARLIRNATANSFMDKNAAEYSNDVAMKKIVAKMIIDAAIVIKSSIAAEADNSGYFAQKLLAKIAASTTAAQLCANSQVKLDALGNSIISQSLDATVTFYFAAPDALCATRLLGVYNAMFENLYIITPDYLTANQLSSFLLQIQTFTELTGTTSAINGGETVLTNKFVADLKVTNADIATLKKVGMKYKTQNEVFYNGLNKACEIPAIAMRHTGITINVLNASNAQAFAGVKATLSKSKQTPVSDVEGIIIFTKVNSGITIGTLEKLGFITQIITEKVIQSKMNTFNYTLTPGIMNTEQREEINLFIATSIASQKALTAKKAKQRKNPRSSNILKL